MPRANTGPQPRANTGPMPRAATGPMPRASTGPIPQVGPGPMPRANTGPMPRATTGPMPRATTGPMPRASTGPIPRVGTGPLPRLGTGPFPAAAGPVPGAPAGPVPGAAPGPDPRASMTAPQRTPSPGAADVPGFEFEARRARDASLREAALRETAPREAGPRESRARTEPGQGMYSSAPFKYTPTVSGGPHRPWVEDRPGFEFDGAFPAARRQRASVRPDAPPARPRAKRRERPSREDRDQARTQARAAEARAPEAGPSEWAKLLRSFLPGQEKPSLGRVFLANLEFKGWALRVGVPILTMIAVGVAVVVVIGAHSGTGQPAPGTAALGFPPATLAGQDFTAAATSRGINQALGRVASDGDEVVAVGAETGALIPRAQFFFSHNDGGSWSLATESVAGGGPPPPGHAARLIAGGQGDWVAIGPDSIWVSGNGEAWTLVSTTGLPAQVTVLRKTSSGFLAAGTNVMYVSTDGTSWRRVPGPPSALELKFVAVAGNSVLAAGEVEADRRIAGHPAVATASQAWISHDGGQTWTPVVVPLGHGAQQQIAGLAAAGPGFVAVRPAVKAGAPVTDVYRSADGVAWTFATTLGGGAGFTPGVMNGGTAGAVITGSSAGQLVAFISADGSTWQQTRGFGSAAALSLPGVAATAGGAVATAVPIDGSKAAPVIKVLAAGATGRDVSLAAIPGAIQRQVAVNAVDAQGTAQVAVGGANGYPAAWMSTDGGSTWSRGTGQTATVLERPGEQQLTSVTDGAAGWLAAGDVTGGAPEHPVVITSANGSVWAAADNEPAFAGGGLFTEQVAASAKGYVIVGYQQTAQGRAIAAAWWSPGLGDWQRAGDAVAGALDGTGNRQMLAVTGTPGGFVAVGVYGSQPAAWITADGRQWRGVALPLPSGATRAALLHVAAIGQTVVAVGTEQTSSGALVPFAARSGNGGATWTLTRLPVPTGIAQVTALAAAGGMFTATGTFGVTPGHQDVVVWTSSDGVTWKATTPAGQGLAGPGIQAITGLTVSGSTLTGVGFTASTTSEQPLFWQSPIR